MCKIIVTEKRDKQHIERIENELCDRFSENLVEEKFVFDYDECNKIYKFKHSLIKTSKNKFRN
jgi:hypothetical protein